MFDIHRMVTVDCDNCGWSSRWRFNGPHAAQRWIDGATATPGDMIDKGPAPGPVGETFHVAGGKVFCLRCTDDMIAASKKTGL